MKSIVIKRFIFSAISAFAGLLALASASLIEEIMKTNTYNKPSTGVVALSGIPLAYLLLLGFALLITRFKHTELKLNLSLSLGLSAAFGIFFAAGCSYNKDYVSSFLVAFLAGLIGSVPVALSQNYLMKKYAQQINRADSD